MNINLSNIKNQIKETTIQSAVTTINLSSRIAHNHTVRVVALTVAVWTISSILNARAFGDVIDWGCTFDGAGQAEIDKFLARLAKTGKATFKGITYNSDGYPIS